MYYAWIRIIGWISMIYNVSIRLYYVQHTRFVYSWTGDNRRSVVYIKSFYSRQKPGTVNMTCGFVFNCSWDAFFNNHTDKKCPIVCNFCG